MISSLGSLYSAVLAGYQTKLKSTPVNITIPDVKTGRDDETQFFNDYVDISYEAFIKSTPSFSTIIEPQVGQSDDDDGPLAIKPIESDDEDEDKEKEKEAREAKEKKDSDNNPSLLTEREKKEIRELKARDQEVRAHEQAHVAAGAPYTGAASYTYERGPDGRNYAVGGDVSINASPIAGDPQATIDKMRIVKKAALAPVEPSMQDRRVAQEASIVEQQARSELARETEESDKVNALASPLEKEEEEEKSQDLLAAASRNVLNFSKTNALVNSSTTPGSIIDTRA